MHSFLQQRILMMGKSLIANKSGGFDADGMFRALLVDEQGLLVTRIGGGTDQLATVQDTDTISFPATENVLYTAGLSYFFNTDTNEWNRDFSIDTSADNVATGDMSRRAVFPYGFDGTTFDRLRSGANNADAVAALALGVLQTNSFLFGFTGTDFDRLRLASAAQAGGGGAADGVLLTADPTQITAQDQPAANTAASAALAAPGVGSRNVVTGLTVSVVADTAAATSIVTATLSDGTTTFWSCKFRAPANDSKQIDISDLEIPGADNAAMTLAVTAGGANTEVTAALRGYLVS
jgi:hypothetical protein